MLNNRKGSKLSTSCKINNVVRTVDLYTHGYQEISYKHYPKLTLVPSRAALLKIHMAKEKFFALLPILCGVVLLKNRIKMMWPCHITVKVPKCLL